MHWFLLLVVSSIRDEENPQLLSRAPGAPPLSQQPTCDVFLAPSTIPGSVYMNIHKENQRHFTCCMIATVFGLIGDICLQLCI